MRDAALTICQVDENPPKQQVRVKRWTQRTSRPQQLFFSAFEISLRFVSCVCELCRLRPIAAEPGNKELRRDFEAGSKKRRRKKANRVAGMEANTAARPITTLLDKSPFSLHIAVST